MVLDWIVERLQQMDCKEMWKLADKVDVSPSTIKNIRYKKTGVKLEVAERLVKELGGHLFIGKVVDTKKEALVGKTLVLKDGYALTMNADDLAALRECYDGVGHIGGK